MTRRRRRNRHNHGPLIDQEDDEDDPCLMIFYNDIFVASDLYVLNLQTYNLITLPHPDRIITILPMSNTGKIVTVCGDQNLRIFDLFSGECERCRRVNNLKCLASFPSNDKILLSGSFDGKLSFWKQVDP
jgi:WD40 repeat protein